VGVWKIRLREKWNMVKIDEKIGSVDTGVQQKIGGNQMLDERRCWSLKGTFH
jgi:hypothetical protein